MTDPHTDFNIACSILRAEHERLTAEAAELREAERAAVKALEEVRTRRADVMEKADAALHVMQVLTELDSMNRAREQAAA
jgi:hypothetical protein